MEWLKSEFDIEALKEAKKDWVIRNQWLSDYRATLTASYPRFVYYFFRVYPEGTTAGWDEYLGFVVIARSLKEAQLMIIDDVYILSHQYVLTMNVEVLGTSELTPHIVMESFNNG